MSRRITVQDLIDEVRSQLDEDNTESIDDTADILPALNRGQDYACNILARHYEEPMLTHTTVTAVGGQEEYDIPEDAFEDRLEKVEVQQTNRRIFTELKQISYRDITNYESIGTVSTPNYYSIVGKKYRILPPSNGTYPFRIWYLKQPDSLVKPQGRITGIVNDDASYGDYLTVDALGSDLTATSDDLNSYINITDGQTGLLKATFQIKQLDTTALRIRIKSSPTRSSVFNKTVDTDILTLNSGLTITEDDIVSTVHGTGVPFFKRPVSNFLIQYAVAELQRKLGGDANLEEGVLQKFEEQVERSWAGRPSTIRVKKVSTNWQRPLRRYFPNSN